MAALVSRTVRCHVVQVKTPVFASVMHVAVNLDSSRSEEAAPQQSYPHICFAVEGFGEDLHSMARSPLLLPLSQ